MTQKKWLEYALCEKLVKNMKVIIRLLYCIYLCTKRSNIKAKQVIIIIQIMLTTQVITHISNFKSSTFQDISLFNSPYNKQINGVSDDKLC